MGSSPTARTSVGLSDCRFHLTFELNEAPLRSQPSKNLDLVVGINKEAGVRVFGPAVLRACVRALELCCGPEEVTLYNRQDERFETACHLRLKQIPKPAW